MAKLVLSEKEANPRPFGVAGHPQAREKAALGEKSPANILILDFQSPDHEKECLLFELIVVFCYGSPGKLIQMPI
jgi:hypothetical protein